MYLMVVMSTLVAWPGVGPALGVGALCGVRTGSGCGGLSVSCRFS